MPTSALVRTGVVAAATFRSTWSGGRGLGLIAAGATYPLLVASIAAAAFPGLDLLATAETLFSTLFVPVVLLLVSLVLGVGLLRGELEEDTLVYPLNRTLPRPALVAGKYLGFVMASLLVLVPSAIGGTAVAVVGGAGPTTSSPGLLEALLALTALGVLVYGAFFLLLGLLTRYALVIGLLYGFLWETFVSLIPGPIRELTVIYYLRGIAAQIVSSGPLGSGPPGVSAPGAIVGLLVFSAAAVALATAYLRWAEIRPAAAPS